jgi:hypothetical protein
MSLSGNTWIQDLAKIREIAVEAFRRLTVRMVGFLGGVITPKVEYPPIATDMGTPLAPLDIVGNPFKAACVALIDVLVFTVFLACRWAKMFRVNTCVVMAKMIQLMFDRPDHGHVGIPMGEYHLPVDFDPTVSFNATGLPYPAWSQFWASFWDRSIPIHLRPKKVVVGFSFLHVHSALQGSAHPPVEPDPEGISKRVSEGEKLVFGLGSIQTSPV